MRLTKTTLAVSVIISAFILVPATAFAQEAAAAGTGDATSGRLLSTIAAAIGLISAGFAVRTFLRGRKKGVNVQRAAVTTACIGGAVVAYALFHLSMFTGALGTGDGRAGAMLAIVFGLAGLIVSGVTLYRAGRTS